MSKRAALGGSFGGPPRPYLDDTVPFDTAVSMPRRPSWETTEREDHMESSRDPTLFERRVPTATMDRDSSSVDAADASGDVYQDMTRARAPQSIMFGQDNNLTYHHDARHSHERNDRERGVDMTGDLDGSDESLCEDTYDNGQAPSDDSFIDGYNIVHPPTGPVNPTEESPRHRINFVTALGSGGRHPAAADLDGPGSANDEDDHDGGGGGSGDLKEDPATHPPHEASSAPWYDHGATYAETGPYGLIIRQIRDTRLSKWNSLEAMPLQNVHLLDDPSVAAELDTIRQAAQNDVQALVEIALELWSAVLQKAEDVDKLQLENDELLAHRTAYETTVKTLEDRVAANAARWKDKFRTALEELDETEQKLIATKRSQRHEDHEEQEGDGVTEENIYNAYTEALDTIRELKSEKANLKRSLAEATTQIDTLTEAVQGASTVIQTTDGADHDHMNAKYSSLQSRYTSVEKLVQDVSAELETKHLRTMALEDTVHDYEHKVQELTELLNAQRDMDLADRSSAPSSSSMGVCLLNELLLQQKGLESLPAIAERTEPKDLTIVVNPALEATPTTVKPNNLLKHPTVVVVSIPPSPQSASANTMLVFRLCHRCSDEEATGVRTPPPKKLSRRSGGSKRLPVFFNTETGEIGRMCKDPCGLKLLDRPETAVCAAKT